MIPYSRRHHADPIPSAPALEARNLCVSYPGDPAPVLDNLSLRIPVGSRAALIGPNGAGKSTLLKAAAGLLTISSGELLVYGHPPGTCHHRVAYLPQRGEVDWKFPISVERLVMSGRYVHLGWFRWPSKQDHAIVAHALIMMGLSAYATTQIGQLSGGQQQRALLARALVQEADLLLFDEPLTAVDAQTSQIIRSALTDLQPLGKTSVVATHDHSDLAKDYNAVFHIRQKQVFATISAVERQSFIAL